jgi:hypothetical protein
VVTGIVVRNYPAFTSAILAGLAAGVLHISAVNAAMATAPAEEAQVAAADGRVRLAWDQALTSPGDAGDYRARLYVDGRLAELSDVACSRTINNVVLTCSGLLPSMSGGSHVLQLAAVIGGVEGTRSAALTHTSVAMLAAGTMARRAAGAPVCTRDGGECYDFELLTTLGREISSPADAGDGRLLFVEAGQHVRVISGDTLLPEAALSVDRATDRIVALGIDAANSETRIVHVAWTEESAAGRTLSVARYRDVGNRFGQRVVVLSGVPLPPLDTARVAFDAANRIYVSVPRGSGSPGTGTLLRYSAEGRIPWEAGQVSPVLGDGFDVPMALANSPATQSVWLAGTNEGRSGELRAIPWAAPAASSFSVAAETAGAALTGDAVSLTVVGTAPARLYAVLSDGRLMRASLVFGAISVQELSFDAGTLVSIAGTAAENLYAVAASAATPDAPLYTLSRLRLRNR